MRSPSMRRSGTTRSPRCRANCAACASTCGAAANRRAPPAGEPSARRFRRRCAGRARLAAHRPLRRGRTFDGRLPCLRAVATGAGTDPRARALQHARGRRRRRAARRPPGDGRAGGARAVGGVDRRADGRAAAESRARRPRRTSPTRCADGSGDARPRGSRSRSAPWPRAGQHRTARVDRRARPW